MTRLTPHAKSIIKELSELLSKAWDESQKTDDSDYWEREKSCILSLYDFNWKSSTGSRIVCGLSHTIDGKFTTDTRVPVTVKFEPWVKPDSRYGNIYEITVWEEAVERDDTDLFANIIDYDEDCKWLAMEECIPIYRQPPPKQDCRDFLHTQKGESIEYFKQNFSERGWYEHDLRHGNIGMDIKTGDIVLLDYGSYTEYKGEKD